MGVRKTGNDDAIAVRLAAGEPYKKISAELKVSRFLIRRRMSEPAFKARVENYRRELVAEAVGRLAVLASQAVETLGDLLASDSEGVKLQAATTILSHLTRIHEHHLTVADLTERLQVLENGHGDVQRNQGTTGKARSRAG